MNPKVMVLDDFPGSSLYNELFGINPNYKRLLEIYNLDNSDKNSKFYIARFRDIYVKNNQIQIYTKLGGSMNKKTYANYINKICTHENYMSYFEYDVYLMFIFEIKKEYEKEILTLKISQGDSRSVKVKFESFKNMSAEEIMKMPGTKNILKRLSEFGIE